MRCTGRAHAAWRCSARRSPPGFPAGSRPGGGPTPRSGRPFRRWSRRPPRSAPNPGKSAAARSRSRPRSSPFGYRSGRLRRRGSSWELLSCSLPAKHDPVLGLESHFADGGAVVGRGILLAGEPEQTGLELDSLRRARGIDQHHAVLKSPAPDVLTPGPDRRPRERIAELVVVFVEPGNAAVSPGFVGEREIAVVEQARRIRVTEETIVRGAAVNVEADDLGRPGVLQYGPVSIHHPAPSGPRLQRPGQTHQRFQETSIELSLPFGVGEVVVGVADQEPPGSELAQTAPLGQVAGVVGGENAGVVAVIVLPVEIPVRPNARCPDAVEEDDVEFRDVAEKHSVLALRQPLRPAPAVGVRSRPSREVDVPRAVLRSPLDLSPLGVQQPPLARIQLAAQIRARDILRVVVDLAEHRVLTDEKDVASSDLRGKLNASKWWLLNAEGRKVQWTPQYRAWDVNLTTWPRADADGRRWPQWLAEGGDGGVFRDIPGFDIVFLDGVGAPPVRAVWSLDGKDDDSNGPGVLAARYAGHLAEWRRLRELAPGRLLIGNTDNDLANAEWEGQLDGGFLEALMGLTWSLETRAGWSRMMDRYRAVLQNTRPPKIVGFNVHGNPTDYRFFRYAYASCLLDDGYFSFTDKARGYGSVPWFDEYDHKLGNALSRPPVGAWSQDVWRRAFQNGVVLVNPTSSAETVKLEPGLLRLAGKQDPATNNSAAVGEVTLQPKDRIVLRRQVATQQFPR